MMNCTRFLWQPDYGGQRCWEPKCLISGDGMALPNLPALAPLQRTLYLVDTKARLSVDNQRYRIERDDQTLLTIPALNVDQIMLFGSAQVTTQALHLAGRHGCSIAYLSYLGRHYGRFEPADDSRIKLLQAQVTHHANNDFGLLLCKKLIAAKLHNCALVLSRQQRHQKGSLQHTGVKQRLKDLESALNATSGIDQLRGHEGAAAALYWKAFSELVPSPWPFDKRRKRPAPDPVNALLSLGYTLLYHSVAGLLQARGLNAHLGWLHVPGGSHLALASDLMETFRAYVVDATVLKLLHTKQLDPEDHQIQQGQCRLGRETVKSFIRALEDRFNGMQKHPQKGQTMDLRRIIDQDIISLTEALKGSDATVFQPTRWR